MTVIIEESGMNFGPYSKEHCLHIEKSNAYVKLQSGIQIAEFLLIQPDKNKLFVIEAKSSSPNPANRSSAEKFDKFITEISEKLLNAFTLGLALCLGRHGHYRDEISSCFQDICHGSLRVILLLIINGHKEEWLVPLNEALQKKLKCASKVWPFEVIAINEKAAQKYGLIQPMT